jgi:SNF2 family DNA or RNA helicase
VNRGDVRVPNIKEINGFFYLENFDPDQIPDWVTQYETTDKLKAYFHLNRTTRKLFKDQLLPLIRTKEVSITPEAYQKIRDYTITNYGQHGVRDIPYISPQGITLKPHQDTAVKIMLDNKRFGFFLGTGTGKTLIAITWILNVDLKKPILIVTPKKVIGQYKQECAKYLDQEKLDLITVTNFEQLHLHFNTRWNAIIIDESHKAKSYTSDVNHNLRALVNNNDAEYVYLFTGTPQDKSRHDILPQLAILDTRFMPSKSKMYERYFRLNDYYQPSMEISDRKKELSDLISEITWGMETEDAIDLTVENNYKVMCPHPLKYYDELKKENIVTIGSDEIVADNEAIMKLKLRQICSGHIKTTEEKPYQVIHLYNHKREALKTLVQTLPNAIIYTEFDEDIIEVTSVLFDLDYSYVIVNGKTKNSDPLIDKFKEGEVDFLVIQSKSGNAGLDLTVTNNVVFYTMPESYIIYHQCKSRIRRIGQEQECNYYHLICRDTVEELVFNSLKKKKSFSTRLFKIYN